MKDKRFAFGVGVTVLWLAFAAFMFFTQTRPEKLNEWGDFFAGYFAPLAFLWLVLGYLQQGEELKASTEALRLQAEELKNSVQQQSELVAVSRAQVQQESVALEEERERRRDAARPKFIPQHSSTATHAQYVDFTMKVVNIGNTATKFRMKFDPPLVASGIRGGTDEVKFHNLGIVARDDVITIQFGASEAPSEATITYYDADGMPGEVRFTIHGQGSKLFLGEVERIT